MVSWFEMTRYLSVRRNVRRLLQGGWRFGIHENEPFIVVAGVFVFFVVGLSLSSLGKKMHEYRTVYTMRAPPSPNTLYVLCLWLNLRGDRRPRLVVRPTATRVLATTPQWPSSAES